MTLNLLNNSDVIPCRHTANISYNNNEKKNNKKCTFSKIELVWNTENTINTVSEVSRADWWRRWLYSTNAKDIGTLYLYFGIFSGILIMPLKILLNTGIIIYNFIVPSPPWLSHGGLGSMSPLAQERAGR